MTVTVKPVGIQAGGETAVQFRRVFQSLYRRPGILASGDFDVTAKSTPDMSVDVAAGQVVVAGSEQTGQGYYVVYNDATVNLAVSAADSTNGRIDLVVAKVEDSEYSGSVDSASVAVVTGTAAATPAAPAAPDNSIILAELSIDANATSVTSADITDERVAQYSQRATSSATIASGSVDSPGKAVTFTVPYADVPDVFLQHDSSIAGGAGDFDARVTACSETGFTVVVFRTAGSNAPAAEVVGFRWRAFPVDA